MSVNKAMNRVVCLEMAVYCEMFQILESIVKAASKINSINVTMGFLAIAALNFSTDYLLFAYVIKKVGVIFGNKWLGLLYGGLILMAASALFCYPQIIIYRYRRKDWLAIDVIRKAKDEFLQNKKGRVWSRIKMHGEIVEFLFLAMKFDPFVTTEFMKNYHGQIKFDKRDWRIFFSSVVVTNVYWSLGIFMGLELFESSIFRDMTLAGLLLIEPLLRQAVGFRKG